MDWQLTFASILVAMATGHVIWRGYRLLRRGASRRPCGSCHGCGESKIDSRGRHIVQLEVRKTISRREVSEGHSTVL